MISASRTVYNNSSRPVPLGMELKPSATAEGKDWDDGILKNLYQLPIDPFRDQVRMLHTNANFCNTMGEIMPCYVSPSLMLNRSYANPEPIKSRNAQQATMGNARNQKPGLLSDPDRMLLFNRTNFIPNQMSAGVLPSHFKSVKSSA